MLGKSDRRIDDGSNLQCIKQLKAVVLGVDGGTSFMKSSKTDCWQAYYCWCCYHPCFLRCTLLCFKLCLFSQCSSCLLLLYIVVVVTVGGGGGGGGRVCIAIVVLALNVTVIVVIFIIIVIACVAGRRDFVD